MTLFVALMVVALLLHTLLALRKFPTGWCQYLDYLQYMQHMQHMQRMRHSDTSLLMV
ncbi:MAG: hypothetical protein ABW168_25150 [Sedimenticola sp.]